MIFLLNISGTICFYQGRVILSYRLISTYEIYTFYFFSPPYRSPRALLSIPRIFKSKSYTMKTIVMSLVFYFVCSYGAFAQNPLTVNRGTPVPATDALQITEDNTNGYIGIGMAASTVPVPSAPLMVSNFAFNPSYPDVIMGIINSTPGGSLTPGNSGVSLAVIRSDGSNADPMVDLIVNGAARQVSVPEIPRLCCMPSMFRMVYSERLVLHSSYRGLCHTS